MMPVNIPTVLVMGDGVYVAWDVENDTQRLVVLSFEVAAMLLNVMDAHGIDYALQMVRTFTDIARAGIPRTDDELDRMAEEASNIRQVLYGLDINRGKIAERDYEMLEVSYHALDTREWTRAQASEIASSMLGRPLTAEAWRKAVDRWAEKQNLPPLGQTRRRPKKVSGH